MFDATNYGDAWNWGSRYGLVFRVLRSRGLGALGVRDLGFARLLRGFEGWGGYSKADVKPGGSGMWRTHRKKTAYN